jgi:hypothetical protein
MKKTILKKFGAKLNNMKRIIFLLLTIVCLSFTTDYKPKHKGMSGIIPKEAHTQLFFNTNVGYYVTFKNNNSTKSCDALEWTAYFYNNFNDLKGFRKGRWSSGNIVQPIKPGAETSDLENVWLDDATKVYITITRVHFSE